MTLSDNMKGNQRTRPIAIVGLGGVFPEARNVWEFWENIVSKKNCIRELPDSFDFDGYYRKEDYYDPDPKARDKTYAKKAGYLPEVQFDPLEFGIPPTSLESISQLQLMALLVAKETLQDAGLLKNDNNSILRSRTGVILGVAGLGGTGFQLAIRLEYPNWSRVIENSGIPEKKVSEIVEKLRALYIDWNEDSFPGFLGNVTAGRIANRFDLGGINCTVDAACASSMGAIKMAVSELSEGNCDAVLTGGVQVDNDVMGFLCFSKTPALSFKGVCRPYDADSDGMLMGAGVGMMVLKRLEDAQRDRDKIYAVIKGIGASSDGRANSIYAPRKSGQLTALRNCYHKAGISPGDIQLIEGHGTGTNAGDTCEISAMLEFFAEVSPRSIALGSVKSQIGHLRAAAGAASMIKMTLSLYHKILPPTINIHKPNPGLAAQDAPLYLNTEPKPWTCPDDKSVRRGAVSSFGFGGTNFHIILEEYRNHNQTDLAFPVHDAVSHNYTVRHRPVDIEPEAESAKNRREVPINGFQYLNPSTRARRDLALNKKEPSQRGKMTKIEPSRQDDKAKPDLKDNKITRKISDQSIWQESVDRLQSQFHENQSGYIELLSRYMEKQFSLLEKLPPGPHLEKILDSFNMAIQILDKNQQRYHDNHDHYLRNQLKLLNARNSYPEQTAPVTTPQISRKTAEPSIDKNLPEPLPEKEAVSSDKQWIPLSPTPQGSPDDSNPYESLGKTSSEPSLKENVPEIPEKVILSSLDDDSGAPVPGAADKAVPQGIDVNRIIEKLQEIISDKTGYPAEMLEPDMDLEADMGVDSIKRLEILGAMQEEFPNIPMELEGVGELRTLKDIASFLEQYFRNEAPADPADDSGDSGNVSHIIDRLRAIILEKTGYTDEMLTKDTNLDEIALDVVQWIDIVSIMQEDFPDIRFDINEMEPLSTLGEVETYLCSYSEAEHTEKERPVSPHPADDIPSPLNDADISETQQKPVNTDPEISPPPIFLSSHQVVISTAGYEAEPLPPRQKEIRLVVKKKALTEPDKMLSVFGENSLWVVMDDGEGVGEKLADEIRRQGSKAVRIAFPEDFPPSDRATTGTTDRLEIAGWNEKHCKAVLSEIRKKYGPVSGFVYIYPFQTSATKSISDLFRKEEHLAVRPAFWFAKHLRSFTPPGSETDRLSFIAVSRMDGSVGLGGNKPFSIFGGSLAGLTRSLRREWPDVFCRFIDIEPGISAEDAAGMVMKEITDPDRNLGETGYDSRGNRCTLEVVRQETASEQTDFLPDKETVFLVSGGARGITAECVIKMAETFKSKFILLGRTSAPEDEPEWAQDCLDETQLREKIISRLKARKQRTTPAEVNKILRPIPAGREIRRTLQMIEKNGGEAIYFSVDITGSNALKRVIEKAMDKFGRIDGLIHGAGNLADKKINRKTVNDFNQVFDCKVRGLQNLLECLDLDHLRSIVLFSSITSLWGNSGQTDYAMANAVLDNFALCSRFLIPEKIVTAVNWGPWDHGMVTPSVKKIYREKQIELISCAEGSRAFINLFKEKVDPLTVVSGNIPIPPPMPQFRKNRLGN